MEEERKRGRDLKVQKKEVTNQCLSQTQWLGLTCQIRGSDQWTGVYPQRLLVRPSSTMRTWPLLQRVFGRRYHGSCMTSNRSLWIPGSYVRLPGKEVIYITCQLRTGHLSFPCPQRQYLRPSPVLKSGGQHGTQERSSIASSPMWPNQS